MSGFDPETGVVRSARLRTGVPLGGIGTGTMQWMSDGTLSHAAITNNWNHPVPNLPGCFAAFWMRSSEKTTARVLALQNAYGLPSVAEIRFSGLTPQLTQECLDTALPFPVTIRAFSPLIPHDLRNSSFPAAVVLFQIKNSSNIPVEISCALSWENLLGMGGTGARGAFQNRTGSRVERIPDAEGIFGLRFVGHPLTPGTATDNRLRDNATGEMALLVRPPRKEVQVFQANWNTLDTRPGWWESFVKDGSLSGDAQNGQEGRVHPAGALAVRLTLKPGDYVEVPFAVAWHTTRHYTTSGVDYGHYYERFFADSLQAGRALLQEWRILLSLTEEWQKRLLFSNLPRWMVFRLINSVGALLTHSIHSYEGRFTLVESLGESVGVGSGKLAGPQERLLAHGVLEAFFPQLNARALTQMTQAQLPDGTLPDWIGDVESTLEPLTSSTVVPETRFPNRAQPMTHERLAEQPENHAQNVRGNLRSTCAFVILTGLHAAGSGDAVFTQRLFPIVARAMDGLRALVGTDGLLAPGTPSSKERFWLDSVYWLSALHFALQMAQRSGQEEPARDWAALLATGKARTAALFPARRLPDDVNEWYYALLPQETIARGLTDFALEQTDAGLRTFQEWDAVRREQGSPWHTLTRTTKENSVSRMHLAQAADWYFLQSLCGFRYQGENQQLTLKPRLPGTWRSLLAPIFTPTFWGRVEFKPRARGGLITFRLDRLLTAPESVIVGRGASGPSLRVQTLQISGTQPGVLTAPDIRVSLGQTPLGHRVTTSPSGELILTLETPLTLAAGDRLEVDLR